MRNAHFNVICFLFRAMCYSFFIIHLNLPSITSECVIVQSPAIDHLLFRRYAVERKKIWTYTKRRKRIHDFDYIVIQSGGKIGCHWIVLRQTGLMFPADSIIIDWWLIASLVTFICSRVILSFNADFYKSRSKTN